MSATIDDALEMLGDSGPEYAGGMANHGPMAAEALTALGRNEAVVPWVEQYLPRLLDHPEARKRIRRNDWRDALGEGGRLGDWVVFFEGELADASWQEVLDRWAPNLLPGLIAAATHGVIRTGHAVRTLGSGETPQRLRELAEGLGYWAARYQRLPETQAEAGKLAPSRAIGQVEPLPAEQRKTTGSITAGLQKLKGHASFGDAVNLVDPEGDVSAFVSELTEASAHLYLANNTDFLRTITFIHAVTGPSAVRLMAPYLSPEARRKAMRYGWQAVAALYAAFGQRTAVDPIDKAETDIDDLIDRAVATNDEHAIKFTEACLREHALNPKPVYLAAARDAAERLRPK